MNKALLLTSAFLMTSCRDDANVFSIQLVQPTWSLLVSALNYFGYIISPDFYTNISKKRLGQVFGVKGSLNIFHSSFAKMNSSPTSNCELT